MTETSEVIGADDRDSGWHSIRTHLIALLTLVVTVVYGAVAIIEINDELSQASDNLDSQTKLLSDVQADALSVPLWNFDRDEVQRQLDVLVVNRDIVKAEVLEENGDVFAVAIAESARQLSAPDAVHHHDDQGSLKNEPELPDFMLGWHDQAFHLVESEIRNDSGQHIGALRVVMTHAHLAEVQEGMFWSHLKKFLIITVVIAITIGAAVTSLVRPVLNITEAMDNVAAGDLSVAIPATNRRDEIGKMARALEVFKANAEQLKLALDKERELNSLQRQFVSMVSHEFRTPLAIIDGSAQRLLRRMEQLSPDRMSQGMTKIRHAVMRLTELMESVLNAARLEEGRIAYRPEGCSLPDILTELTSSYAEIHSDREFTLRIEQLPDEIVADPKLLRQVFSNLLSNACKYSGDGTAICIEGRRSGPHSAAVSVRDEGVGIPSDELEKLFERFFRASTSTGIAGTGIGLHLVHHFVGLHDGRIEVTSTVGEGTSFTVHLPCLTPQPDVIPDALEATAEEAA